MRVFVKNLWREPFAWIYLGSFGLVLVGCIWAALWYQRADYQRRLDASVLEMISQVKAELESLRQQDAKSLRDRQSIRKDVEELKGEVKP